MKDANGKGPEHTDRIAEEALKELEVLGQEKESAQRKSQFSCNLVVKDARRRDVGRGIARIDQSTMKKLGISPGDVIEINGKRNTVAIAWPAYSEDQNKGLIRIDGFTRKNARVAMNEYVVVKPAKVKDATSVVLTPIDMRLNVDQDFTNFVKNRLMERTFVEGDSTLLMMLGHAIPFTVTKTSPGGIVGITSGTDLQILSEPATFEISNPNDIKSLGVRVEVLTKRLRYNKLYAKCKVVLKHQDIEKAETSFSFSIPERDLNRFSERINDYQNIAKRELEIIKARLEENLAKMRETYHVSLYDLLSEIIGKMKAS